MNIQSVEGFIGTAESKGYVTSSVAKQTRTAIEKMKRIVEPEELTSADLQKEGVVEDIFRRFMTKYSNELTSESANVYVARVKKAVDNGARYLADPLSFKSTFNQAARERSQTTRVENKTKKASASEVSSEEQFHTDEFFTTNFPLRKNYMLPIKLPKDLCREEVQRIAYHLLTLCSDFNPAQPNVWHQDGPPAKTNLPTH